MRALLKFSAILCVAWIYGSPDASLFATAAENTVKPSRNQPNQVSQVPDPGKIPSDLCPKEPKRLWTTLPQTPQLPSPKEQGFVPVNGVKIYYARFGHGNPVILLHGGLANSNYWGSQIPEIAAKYDVIAVDLRGHGRSTLSAQPMSYDLMASDIVGLMDFLKLRKVAIVGWSDGAIVGLTLAMKYPRRVNKVFAFGANFNIHGLISGGSHSSVFSTYKDRTAVEYHTMSPQPDQYTALLRNMARMWGSEPDFSKADLARIDVPVTIADGDHDEIIKLQHTKDLAAAIASATLLIQPCVSHFSML
jgi:pimeloyl-ACP methyl ester carboxylesterase